MKRTIKIVNDNGIYLDRFDGPEYAVDLDCRNYDHDMAGAIRCHCAPFPGIPLAVHLDILPDGHIEVCAWEFTDRYNSYVHADDVLCRDVKPTSKQCETVVGLLSHRITVAGLRLCPGKTLLGICPIDLKAEEERTGEKILLA